MHFRLCRGSRLARISFKSFESLTFRVSFELNSSFVNQSNMQLRTLLGLGILCCFSTIINAATFQQSTIDSTKSYYYHTLAVSYTEAETLCKSLGGTIATIDSSTVQRYLRNTVAPNKKFWIGAKAVGGNKRYSWLDGRAIASSVSRWYSTQPDCTESCCGAWLDTDDTWMDSECEAKWTVICEKPFKPPPSPYEEQELRIDQLNLTTTEHATKLRALLKAAEKEKEKEIQSFNDILQFLLPDASGQTTTVNITFLKNFFKAYETQVDLAKVDVENLKLTIIAHKEHVNATINTVRTNISESLHQALSNSTMAMDIVNSEVETIKANTAQVKQNLEFLKSNWTQLAENVGERIYEKTKNISALNEQIRELTQNVTTTLALERQSRASKEDIRLERDELLRKVDGLYWFSAISLVAMLLVSGSIVAYFVFKTPSDPEAHEDNTFLHRQLKSESSVVEDGNYNIALTSDE